MFDINKIKSEFSVGQRVEVISEDDKCYGIQGYVTKTAFGECEVLMQSNQKTWFGDNQLQLIPSKKV